MGARAAITAELAWWRADRWRGLLGALLLVKLGIEAVNAWSFNGQTYDQAHHLWRAYGAGLVVDKMAYDPPLYYLPMLGWIGAAGAGLVHAPESTADDAGVLTLLRLTNVAWSTAFFVAWIRGVLPRLLPDRTAWFVASVTLLAIPGYQKLAAMVHADNAFAALSGVVFWAWLTLREREATSIRSLAAYAAAVGLLGLTRPFAVVPVFLFWLGGLGLARRGATPGGFARRAALISVISGGLAGSWHAYRAFSADAVLQAYDDDYVARYQVHRDEFNFASYFTTFSPRQLIQSPGRQIAEVDSRHRKKWWTNRYTNSFFTILYSEVWGDHWLYFSGPWRHDQKVQAKRISFIAAGPLTFGLLFRGVAGAWGVAWEAGQRWRRRERQSPEAVVLVWFLLGAALYLWWQTGPALLPGKNSTIKFIYNATLVPLAVVLATRGRLRPGWLWVSAVLLAWVGALGVAAFDPTIGDAPLAPTDALDAR